MPSAVRSKALAVLAGIATLAPAACTMTTIHCDDLPAGHEVVLRLDSSRSPLRVVNLGPGPVFVSTQGAGNAAGGPEPGGLLEIGIRDIPLHGPLTVVVGNRSQGGPAVAVRLEIKDPAVFSVAQRAAAQESGR